MMPPSGGTPPSLGGVIVPHVPVGDPGGMLQVKPAQQSPVDVQTPPAWMHMAPQRRTPFWSGTQGSPLQHSAEKRHMPPTAMQQPGVPS